MIEFTLISEELLESVQELVLELESAVTRAQFERSDELADALRALLQSQSRACLAEEPWQALEQCLRRRLPGYVPGYLVEPSLAGELNQCLGQSTTLPLPALLARASAEGCYVLQLPLDGEDPLEATQQP